MSLLGLSLANPLSASEVNRIDTATTSTTYNSNNITTSETPRTIDTLLFGKDPTYWKMLDVTTDEQTLEGILREALQG